MKRGTPEHPKTQELSTLLGVGFVKTIGHLELLFHFTAQYAPQGDIGKFSDKWIAAGCRWKGAPSLFINSLLTAGYLELSESHRLVVHDWVDHADGAVRKRLERAKKIIHTNQEDEGKMSGHRRTHPPIVADPPCLIPALSPPTPIPHSNGRDWDRFQREYPGEVIPDRDAHAFFSVIETEADEALLFENLPAWSESRKFRDGYAPAARKFLFDGHWKVKPKPDVKSADGIVEQLCRQTKTL